MITLSVVHNAVYETKAKVCELVNYCQRVIHLAGYNSFARDELTKKSVVCEPFAPHKDDKHTYFDGEKILMTTKYSL